MFDGEFPGCGRDLGKGEGATGTGHGLAGEAAGSVPKGKTGTRDDSLLVIQYDAGECGN